MARSHRRPNYRGLGFKGSLTLVAVLFSSSVCSAAGTDAASFLNIPTGAGPAALGGAYTALATDAYAPVYNASGLAFLPSLQLAGLHVNYLESINYEFLSYVHPLGSEQRSYGGIGASVQYLTTGEIDEFDHFGAKRGSFSGRSASYNLSYGFPISKAWGIGATGKIISASIQGVSANATAADIGTIYQLMKTWNVAAAYANWGSSLRFLGDSERLPEAFHLATSFSVSHRSLFTIEEVFPKSDSASFRGGLQFEPIEFLRLRVGYRTDTVKQANGMTGFTAGAGFVLYGQELAYAWIPYGDLGDTHYFSLLINFGQTGNVGVPRD